MDDGRLVDAGDTRLFVAERGDGPLPLIVLHGGPGLDHTQFGDHLDALSDSCRLLLVDQRAQGRSEPAPPQTWTLEQLAADVEALAATLQLDRYAVLGHSFGAFVALQHAVDFAGRPVASIISSGVPDASFLSVVDDNLAAFEPEELREQVTSSWAREAHAQTQEDCRQILSDQLPFHFADPRDPRIEVERQRLAGMVFAPDVLRAAAGEDYGAIAVSDRLGEITQPLLAITGRHDRVCTVSAAQAIAEGAPNGRLAVLEDSAHMGYIEQEEEYVSTIRRLLGAVA